jgi:hypothetical protein
MKFKVPIRQDTTYPTEVFNMISSNLQELASEYGRWPDKIVFSGNLGKEVYQVILDKGWDLEKFGPYYNGGAANTITFKYSTRFDLVEERGAIPSSIDNITVNTILSPDEMQKILQSKLQLSYTIERRVDPKIVVYLTRN